MAAPGRRAPSRPLALTRAAVEALRNHQRRQAEERRRAGDAWVEHDLVFRGPRGGPLNLAYLRDGCFYPLLARAGLPRLRFADLSQAAATVAVWEAPARPVANQRPMRDRVADAGNLVGRAEAADANCGPVVVEGPKERSP